MFLYGCREGFIKYADSSTESAVDNQKDSWCGPAAVAVYPRIDGLLFAFIMLESEA